MYPKAFPLGKCCACWKGDLYTHILRRPRFRVKLYAYVCSKLNKVLVLLPQSKSSHDTPVCDYLKRTLVPVTWGRFLLIDFTNQNAFYKSDSVYVFVKCPDVL